MQSIKRVLETTLQQEQFVFLKSHSIQRLLSLLREGNLCSDVLELDPESYEFERCSYVYNGKITEGITIALTFYMQNLKSELDNLSYRNYLNYFSRPYSSEHNILFSQFVNECLQKLKD